MSTSERYRPLKQRTPEEEAALKKDQEERLRKWEEDIRLAVPREIEKLRKEAEEKVSQADKLERLHQAYPGLKRQVGRWNKVAYCSKSVNEKVTNYDCRHNCGCCPDSPLEIWPYVETPDGKVYSDPPCFTVGERHWMGGDRPSEGWREKLQAASIPEEIIKRIGYHFDKDREDRIAAASDDEERSEEDDGS